MIQSKKIEKLIERFNLRQALYLSTGYSDFNVFQEELQMLNRTSEDIDLQQIVEFIEKKSPVEFLLSFILNKKEN